MSDKLSFLDQIRKHAEQIPNAEAIVAPGRKPLRYGQLWFCVTNVVASLENMGLAGDHSIVVALPDGPELAVMLPASDCFRCGSLSMKI